MPDLVGIGSINIDVIVGLGPGADERAGGAEHGVDLTGHGVDLTDPRLGLDPGDIGVERQATPAQIRSAIDYLAQFDPVLSPGGSALNTISGVAATGAPVSVGHIGVLGRHGPAGIDLAAWLERLGVDTGLGRVVDGPPGLCLSVNHRGQRTLLTTGGVNDGLSDHLAERRTEIVDALARARLVHLTSLAGLDDLDPLVDLLDDLRAPAPNGTGGPILSCDPGAIWTSPNRPAGADAVLARCHQLLVNRHEVEALGGIDAIFDRWPDVELVVVKGADGVDIERPNRPPHHHPNPEVLAPDQIVDDTGSGDAFAAGFLIGQILDHLDEANGVALGMDLARAKLGFCGVTGIETFADLWVQFAPSGPHH